VNYFALVVLDTEFCGGTTVQARQASISDELGRKESKTSVGSSELSHRRGTSLSRKCIASCITHAHGSCVSIAIISVCDSVSVCLFVCTIKPKQLKLKSTNLAQG